MARVARMTDAIVKTNLRRQASDIK
jgi:hypothetical protein